MSDVTPIGQPAATALGAPGRIGKAPTPPPAAARGADKVELSSAAQWLSRIKELPSVRQDLIDRVRAEIAAGDYETPDKLDAALDELLEDLR